MPERDTLVTGAVDGCLSSDVGRALWRLEDARLRTLTLLEAVPENCVDRGTQDNTIGTILYYVALIEADWLYSEILEQPVGEHIAALLPADDRDPDGVLTAVRGERMEQHLDRLRAVREDLVSALRDMSSDEFERVRSLPQYDVTPAWVLHHLAQHEAEHRGEIGSILAELRSNPL